MAKLDNLHAGEARPLDAESSGAIVRAAARAARKAARPPRRELLSIVVPCFNEDAVIGETVRRLGLLADGLADLDVELVFVDDGSRDATRALLRDHAERDERIRVIGFSRNFGHQVAVTAGIAAASGDAVVLIDADLQDPPQVIREMVARWREGYDVAYGTRTERDGESAFKLVTARAFYRFLNTMSDVAIPHDTGDFRLMSRKVVDVLSAMPEADRFVRGMVSWVGFRQVAVPYARAPRFAGESKYPLRKMLRFATDGVLSFSTKPLQLSISFGLFTAGLALAGIVYTLAVRLLTHDWVAGWAGLMLTVLFMGGVQLVFLGILGEYVGRIYNETKRRPLYIVEERVGFEETAPAAGRTDRRA